MNYSFLISFIGAGSCLGLAAWVLVRDRRPLVHKIFIAGMLVLSAEAILAGIGFKAMTPIEVAKYQRIRLVAASLIPGVWLLFTSVYGRINSKEILKKYRWVIFVAFVLPLVLATVFSGSFFTGEPVQIRSSSWVIRLGWPGQVFCLSLLVCFVLILMNLERTLRASAGHIRWQVKFMVVGLGGLFAFRLYTFSQAILYRSWDTDLVLIDSVALIVANPLILKTLLRSEKLSVDFYLSHSLFYNSFSLFIVGACFLAVAILAEGLSHLKGESLGYFDAFLVFLAITAISVLFLSDRVRNRMKRFFSVHFKRPLYDYRKEWEEFVQATICQTEVGDLCSAIVKKVSRTFETLSVTIWLLDERGKNLLLGGSTVFTASQARNIKLWEHGANDFTRAMQSQQTLVDFEHPEEKLALDFKEKNYNYLKEAQMRYCLPLRSGGQLLGVLTLAERVGNEPLTFADMDLLRTISDQTASMLLNLRLSERLREAKQLEAFQTMSAFVMHDLKNLASTLSLTIQNLPTHFDKEEFRKDALQIMQQSSAKVNRMCSRLSTLSKRIELKRAETDLNSVVRASISSLKGLSNIALHSDFCPLPRLMIDSEQIEKVVCNLILNASEAVQRGGEVRVSTEENNGWAILSVSDNGSGISKEFMEQSLFRPFKTTKKQGMGIGLFHSRMVVETHHGHMEVESEEGKGSTFRVFLPLKE